MKGSRNDRPDKRGGPPPPRAILKGPSGGQSPRREGAASHYLPRFFIESSQLPESPPSIFVSPSAALGQEFVLGPEDTHHALRVLRLQLGDECELVVTPPDVNGEESRASRGQAYLATVQAVGNEVRVKLVEHLQGGQAGPDYLTTVGMVQAIARPSAMDYLLEKGTEVGTDFFLLLPASGSPSRSRLAQSARLTRWRRIVREASKQSKQLAIPSLEMQGSVDEALDRLGQESLSLVLEPEAPDRLYEFLSSTWGADSSARMLHPDERPGRIALWVGPESGWSDVELAALSAAGARPVRLGQSVLRTETAGPVAVAVARLALGDW